eukprot:tig00000863_g5007.t1
MDARRLRSAFIAPTPATVRAKQSEFCGTRVHRCLRYSAALRPTRAASEHARAQARRADVPVAAGGKAEERAFAAPERAFAAPERAARRQFIAALAAAALVANANPAAASPITGPFRNRYWIVRHCESTANAGGFICSDPVIGLGQRCALTSRGKELARETAQKVADAAGGGRVLIFTSDFTRAQATADIIAREIGGEVRVALELRERFFGSLEGKPVEGNCEAVWEADSRDPSSHYAGAESVLEVFGRVSSFVTSTEKAWSNKRIVLVSHGDTLQILQAAVTGSDPKTHRRDFAISNGEVRALVPRDA